MGSSKLFEPTSCILLPLNSKQCPFRISFCQQFLYTCLIRSIPPLPFQSLYYFSDPLIPNFLMQYALYNSIDYILIHRQLLPVHDFQNMDSRRSKKRFGDFSLRQSKSNIFKLNSSLQSFNPTALPIIRITFHQSREIQSELIPDSLINRVHPSFFFFQMPGSYCLWQILKNLHYLHFPSTCFQCHFLIGNTNAAIYRLFINQTIPHQLNPILFLLFAKGSSCIESDSFSSFNFLYCLRKQQCIFFRGKIPPPTCPIMMIRIFKFRTGNLSPVNTHQHRIFLRKSQNSQKTGT